MPDQTLFVGNGPNRIKRDVHSWGGVLEEVAVFAGQQAVYEQRIEKPFTLLYEEMAIQAAAEGLQDLQLKQRVAEWMQRLSPHPVHERLLRMARRHVLTTNYDYGLEGEDSGIRADLSNEARYSLFRCREVGAKRVWHIHGELEKPETITLGYEHYIGSLYKARNYVSLLSARPKTSPKDYRSPVMHQHYNFEDRTDGPYSWVDIFLRDDIHIVGFNCDYSELDVWWLLSLKERLRQRDRRLAKGIKVGRTVFYHFEQPDDSLAARAKLAALRNFGVDVVCIPVNGSYASAWDDLCRLLERVA